MFVISAIGVLRIEKPHNSGRAYLTPSEAMAHLGSIQTVRFNVGYTYQDHNGTEFLDQYADYLSGFVVGIYPNYLYRFSFDPASFCLYRSVDVTGTLRWYRGFLEILNPLEITVVKQG